MPEITLEGALVQAVHALQQLESLADGTPLAGACYLTGLMVGEVLDAITSGAEDAPEEAK